VTASKSTGQPGHAFEDGDERFAVGLAGRQKSQHERLIVPQKLQRLVGSEALVSREVASIGRAAVLQSGAPLLVLLALSRVEGSEEEIWRRSNALRIVLSSPIAVRRSISRPAVPSRLL
jgi:hypothetical protein